MHARLILPFAVITLLAACGEEQTAEAPPTTTTQTAEETAQASPPVTPAAPDTTAETGTAVTPGETTDTADAADAAATPPATGSTQTAATSTMSLEPFQGRDFDAGVMTIRLNPDDTFVMNEVDGNRQVEGRYAFQDGIVTFSDPKGDIGPAQFPMRCRFEPVGTGEFRLADTEGACTRFKDLTFKPAAG